jgi:hypothetical protein
LTTRSPITFDWNLPLPREDQLVQLSDRSEIEEEINLKCFDQRFWWSR